MAYCGLKSRAIYFIPLTCNFVELQCWQKKINWRIRNTMLQLSVCIFIIRNGNIRSRKWTSEIVSKIWDMDYTIILSFISFHGTWKSRCLLRNGRGKCQSNFLFKVAIFLYTLLPLNLCLAVYSPGTLGTLFCTCPLCWCLLGWIAAESFLSPFSLPEHPKGIVWKFCPVSKESCWKSLFYNA